ncbi:MAG: HEAT repeat domain-containing protein [Phycisphaerales bacterium]
MALPRPFAHRPFTSRMLLVAGLAFACVPAAAQSERPPEPPRTDIDVTSTLSRSQLRESAISTLVEATRSDNALTRANAIEALQKAPNRALAAIRRGLRDDNVGVRYTAAMSASELRLREAADDLRLLVDDPDPRVRAAAICALRQCGEDADPTPIARMLASNDLRMRANAAFILGEIGDPSAVPMLRDMTSQLPDVGLPSEQRVFRMQVAEALIKLGWKDGIHAVRAGLYPSSPEEVESAILAAQIIGEVRDRGSVPELVNRIEDRVSDSNEYLMPPEMRLAAATSLAKMGYTDGRYVAIEHIASPDQMLRAQAALTLGFTGTGPDLQILDALLQDDPSPLVRVAAASGVLTLSERVGPNPR